MIQTSESDFSISLEEIRDTLNHIAWNTSPIISFDRYYSISEGKVAIIALLISLFAALFSYLCYIFQKRTVDLLKLANQRRPNLYSIVSQIYENSILLQMIFEYDSDYDMSYTAEKRCVGYEKPSQKKHLFIDYYPAENIFTQLMIPEDSIILHKYEVFECEKIYDIAFNIIKDIRKYNESVESSIKHFIEKEDERTLLKDKDNIISYGRKLIRELFELDELVQNDKNNRKKIRNTKSDFFLFLSARCLDNIRSVTSNMVIADSYYDLKSGVIEANEEIYVSELKKKLFFLKNKKNEYLLQFEKDTLRHLNGALLFVSLINGRKKEGETSTSPNNSVLKTYYILGNVIKWFHHGSPKQGSKSLYWKIDRKIKILESPLFQDDTIKKSINDILGKGTYEKIIEQIDKGVVSVEYVVKIDTLMQIFLKRDAILTGTNRSREERRLARKKIFMDEKKKDVH